MNTTRDKLRWASMHFTQEEDLCLISADGNVFLIDPLTGDDREKPVSLGAEFMQKNI